MRTDKPQPTFQHPFSFEGRIRRSEYFISFVFYVFLVLAVKVLTSIGGFAIIFLLAHIPMAWFILAQGAKRCHDLGNSGFYQYIPLYNFVLLFADGDAGENEYGINQKGIGNKQQSTEE